MKCEIKAVNDNLEKVIREEVVKSLNTIYKSRGEPEYVGEPETHEYNPNDPS